MSKRSNTLIERFFEKIKKTDHCWNWMACTSKGYGLFCVGNKKMKYAHRFSYEIKKGEIPSGLHIDHLCRNTLCVNPDHLEAVTPKENMLRGFSNAKFFGMRTHCKNGHEFTKENTYFRKKGHGRFCRTCDRIRKSPHLHIAGFSATQSPVLKPFP